MDEISKGYDKETLDKLHNVELEIMKDFSDICEANQLEYFLCYGTLLGCVRHQGFIPWDDDVDVAMTREDYEKLQQIMKDHPKYSLLSTDLVPEYMSIVTHFQKKGTQFISHYSRHIKCDFGINIDIFIVDKISKKEGQRKKAIIYTYFLRRMLFLLGTPFPHIPLKGWKKTVSSIICYIGHYCLKILHFTPHKIYQLFTKYATQSRKEIETDLCIFGEKLDESIVIDRDDLYPLKKMKFEQYEFFVPNNYNSILTNDYGDYMKIPDKENQINHAPFFIDFGDENN